MKTMADYPLNDILDRENNKIIYVYDFLNMWTFFVELAAIEEPESGISYPDLLFAHGIMPANAPDMQFGSGTDEEDLYGDYDDEGYDDEDLDMLNDDNFEDLGFDDRNWN